MEDQIQSHGVYVKGASNYVKAGLYPHMYVEFKYFDEIPFVERKDEKLEIIVFEKSINPNNVEFLVRSFAVTAASEELEIEVSAMDKEDMYKVTVNRPLPKDTILMIWGIGEWGSPALIISLGEPQEQLEKLFSDLTQTPAYAVLPSLEESCQAFSQNKVLQALLPAWQKLAEKESETRDIKYVEEAWTRYESVETTQAQIQFLYKTYQEISGYLNKHPQDSKVREYKERQAWMDTKIEELEKAEG